MPNLTHDEQISYWVELAQKQVRENGFAAGIQQIYLAGIGYLRDGQLQLSKQVAAQGQFLEALTKQVTKINNRTEPSSQTRTQKVRGYSIPASVGAAFGGAVVVLWDYMRRLF